MFPDWIAQVPQRYDPAEADAALRRYPLRVLRRLWLLVKLVLVFFVTDWWSRRGFLSKEPAAAAAREKRAAVRFRDAIVELGPTFIKIGQMLATRPDILPLGYTHELATLQDRVPPFDSGRAMAIIRQELGRDVTAIFAEFDVRPLSAASIGQVHLARLVTGEQVIVKVQRPNLPEIIALDLAIMRRLAAWAMGRDLSKFGVPVAKDMPYVAIVDRLAESLYEQIDFIREAENIETFRRNFRDFPGVSAPKPYWDYTTTRVLTEEYIEGFKFDDYEGIRAAGLDYVAIANLGVRAFIKQVLEDGYFHADTHPGNVLIRPSGEVVYIDFGMVDTIPPDLQQVLVDLFIHLVHLNFDAFISDLIRLDFLPEQVDRARVIPIVEDIYTTQMGLSGRTYSTREIIDRVSQVMYDYPFYLPERFAFLMRSVASMEGTVLAHVPDYKFLNVGLPFAGKLMLNPEQRVIREKLVTELMAGGELQLDRLLELFDYASREPTFRVGELAQGALAYLFSEEGRRFRSALTTSVLVPEMLAPDGTLDRIFGRILADPSVDPYEVLHALAAFLQTPEGLEWLELALPRLRYLLPSSFLGARLPAMVDRLVAGHSVDSVLTELMPVVKGMLSDRALSLQPLIDWLTAWFADPVGRELVLGWAGLVEQIGPARRNDMLYVALMALEHPELDLAPLIGELADLLTTPEAETFRNVAIRWFETGEVDQAMLQLLQRALFDRALRSEMFGVLLPALRFLGSPEAGDTRMRLLEATWKRLTSFPFTLRRFP